MELRKGDKIIYKEKEVEKEGIIVAPLLIDSEENELVHVESPITKKHSFILRSNVFMVIRENTILVRTVYEKPEEKYVRVVYKNGKRTEHSSPLRLFILFYYDAETNSFCMEVNGAKNPYPFRKAYGVNPNMIEKCLNDLGWKKVKENYFKK